MSTIAMCGTCGHHPVETDDRCRLCQRVYLETTQQSAITSLELLEAAIKAALNGELHRDDLRATVERCIWEWERSGLGSIPTCDEVDEALLADRRRRKAEAAS